MRWVLLAAPLVLTLPGCTCEGGPYLGTADSASPAIGWSTEGGEVVHGVRLEEADGTVVWEISSAGADPSVLEVGAAADGFTTVVPLDGAVDLSGRVLRLLYDDAGGRAVEGATWSFLDHAYEPGSRRAAVEERECGLGALDLHLGRRLTIVAAGIAAISLAVIAPVALHGGARARASEREER